MYQRSASPASDLPPTRKPRTKRKHAQGKSLLEALRAAGIEASDASRNRRTGIYTVRFVAPNVGDFNSRGTDPAKVWATRITNALTDVEVVNTYDSRADWRAGNPVLFALVMVRWEQKSV